MDRQEAIEFLLDHYQNPRNSGAFEPVDVTMPGGNPGCGDVVTIYLKVNPAGVSTSSNCATLASRRCVTSAYSLSFPLSRCSARP